MAAFYKQEKSLHINALFLHNILKISGEEAPQIFTLLTFI